MTPQAYLLVQSLYDAINERNVAKAMDLVDQNCLYQDLNFTRSFQGKAAVEQLLTESCQGIPADLQFVIDDITSGDSLAVGVLWHVELDGIPIPNGRGVSFCRISEETGKLSFARDLVEPVVKPGKGAFFILRLIVPLVRLLLKQTHSAERGKETGQEQTSSSQADLSDIEE